MIWPLVRNLVFRLDAERAHRLSMAGFLAAASHPLGRRLLARRYVVDDARLGCRRFDLAFPSPVGLAAGFDKDAEWYNELALFGFGFIEVGTLTARPQSGNPRPRLFRLPADGAILNRFGFNNRGSGAAALDLARRRIGPLLGVNIGKSKVVPNERATEDYLASFELLYPFGKYFVVNVSSPNTPGLRQLQDRAPLERLLAALQNRNRELAAVHRVGLRPLLLKIAPDLSEPQREEAVGLAVDLRLAGIVATNTTVSREGLRTPAQVVARLGAGGISGSPLTQRSRDFVRAVYRQTAGRMPIIGVGGIMSGEDAWQMFRAGASLVQVYTGFVYGGPGFVRDVHRHLLRRLDAEKVAALDDVIGRDAAE